MSNKHTCKDTEEPLYAYYLTMAAFLRKTKNQRFYYICSRDKVEDIKRIKFHKRYCTIVLLWEAFKL